MRTSITYVEIASPTIHSTMAKTAVIQMIWWKTIRAASAKGDMPVQGSGWSAIFVKTGFMIAVLICKLFIYMIKPSVI